MASPRLAAAREKLWGLPVPGHLIHKRDSWAARVYGCDCKACLPSGRRQNPVPLTRAQRNAKLRAAKKGQPVPPGVKHGIYAYQVYACHCDVCVEAHNAKRREARQTWRADAVGDWVDNVVIDGHKTTVVHWPPRGEGMWQCPVCDDKFPHR